MSRIRGKGNKATELALIAIFHLHGITGWRRSQNIYGKPDFAFRRQKVIVFVDGCFWHGCPKHYLMPKGNREFWANKISGNRLRDRKVNAFLRKAGWRVIRVWQHELLKKSRNRLLKRLSHLISEQTQQSAQNAGCGTSLSVPRRHEARAGRKNR